MNDLTFFGYSVTGGRENNEDTFITEKIGPNSFVFAVADGMGGAAAGEVASKLAVDTLLDNLRNISKIEDAKALFENTFIQIQKLIKEKVSENPDLNSMGTTLTAALIIDNKIVWANLGDSRIYRIKNNTIKQITRDHSYIEDYKEKYGNKADKAILENFKNYITRSLDGGDDKPDIFPKESLYEKIDGNQIYLLCSDGLLTDVEKENEDFKKIILSNSSLEDSCLQLVDFALENGSSDNVTVVLVEKGKVERLKKGAPVQPILPKLLFKLIAVLAAILLFIALIYFDTSYFSKKIQNQITSVFNRQNDSIPLTKQYHDLNHIEWLPFDENDFSSPPFGLDDRLCWNIFPEKKIVSKYVLIISDIKNQKTDTLLLKQNDRSIRIKDLPGSDYGKTFSLTMQALLIDGQTMFEGNSINLIIRKK